MDILGFSFDLAASTFEMARGMFGDKGAIKKMRDVSATFDKRIEKALEGVEGRVGGHDQASGGMIKDYDWDKFIENLRGLV